MKLSKQEYYSLPHMRAMRRKVRRMARACIHGLTPHNGVKCTVKLHDKNGDNCLKSKRYKGRFLKDSAVLKSV